MRGITREEILRAAAEYGKAESGRLTLHGFERASGISFSQVYYWWPEGWYAVLDAAGLAERASRTRPVSDHVLMAELDRIAESLGRLPRWTELRAHGRHSPSVYQARFRTWEGVERAYRKWLRERKPGAKPWERAARKRRDRTGEGKWRATEGSLGEPLGMRAVTYAPMNEQGVVLLFGVLCAELGFVVERVGTAFPDCAALRRSVDGKRWERVAIEFEFRSCGFRQHGHDEAGCDLIVCWEHDWAECPLEVLELRAVVAGRPLPALEADDGAA